MRKLLILFFILVYQFSISQDIDLSYYLPQDISYDESIPTPKKFIGHEVGEWHVTHDKQYYYMKELARLSDRITLSEYARTYEDRPLIYLTITSTQNRNNLESIRLEHKKLTDPAVSDEVDIDQLPVIIYQGNSIHGNEPSGGNGALAVAYYLAAAQGPEIDRLLSESVILFDPCYNPDGFQRFSTWVNAHKGKNLISDPNSREYTEAWPRGRTNHYWFDLNRDWLLLTHPESQGRIKTFHHWKPDILTDHHEMGSNSTFFFQPGIPSRTNPNTPILNQELTAKIGEFHAAALDKIGSLYYSKESYDDYYYGKGSTYPDAQGCIGILFEQASSRGHYQETDHGILSFPFTIRNQVATMLSTQEAGINLRKELLEYKRQSFKEANDLSKKNPVKGYVFNDDNDPYRAERFISILQQHQIDVFKLNKEVEGFGTDGSYFVPLEAKQYRLTKSIFEEVREFQDSLFYDVSAWTMPHAFNLPFKGLRNVSNLKGNIVDLDKDMVNGQVIGGNNDAYAYLIPWNQYLAPRMLNQLHNKDLLVKVATKNFISIIDGSSINFERGTLIIPVGNNQQANASDLGEEMNKLAKENHLTIYRTTSGQTPEGVDLGSRSSEKLSPENIMVVIGDGVNSYDAGEIWHHFDQVLDVTVSLVDVNLFDRVKLDNYTTIILPDGIYNELNNSVNDLKNWVRSGGNLVAFKRAISWLDTKEIINVDNKKGSISAETDRIPFAQASQKRGAKVTGGMIAKGEIDTTHPLFYGYNRSNMYFFKRGNFYYKHNKDPYTTPAIYTSDPVASGYIQKTNEERLAEAAAVLVHNLGSGTIISIVDDPLFRGYWWGGSKLFANAIYMNGLLN